MPESAHGPVKVIFVCWGNICRSPIAERVAEQTAADADLTGVEFTSAATSTEELGAPIDPRARAVLGRRGYRTEGHRAHQISRTELNQADLVIAMEDLHVRKLEALDPAARNVSLLTDYDPAATAGSGVPDPWYGEDSGFEETLAAIEAAMPGILDRVRDLQSARSR